MTGRTLRTIRTQASRLEGNSSGLLERLFAEVNFLPETIRLEDPPRGYVPMDLGDSPFFVPPEQGSEYPDPSDYGLTLRFVSFEIEEISVSRCHICVTFSYAIGFIKFPSSTVCYIAPECRREEPHPEIPLTCTNRTEVTWDELDNSNTTFGVPPVCPPPNAPENMVLGEPGETLIFEFWRQEGFNGKYAFKVNGVSSTEETRYFPPAELISRRTFTAPVIIKYRQDSQVYDSSYSSTDDINPNRVHLARINSYRVGYDLANLPWTWTFISSTAGRRYTYDFGSSGLNTFRSIESNSITRGFTKSWTIVKRQTGEIVWPPPPEPEETPKRRMPRCCENPTIERLLRELLKRVGDPKKITIPVYDKARERRVSSLASAIEQWSYHQSNSTADLYKVIEPRAFEGAEYPMRLSHAGAKGNKPIRNYLQAWEVILRQIDTAVGLLPFKLKIEDTNAAQEGKQSIELQVHSISDALKLLVENVLDIEGDGDVTNNLLVRMAAMLIQQHQVLTKIYSQTRNTEEYLDYKVKQKIEKVPSTLNPLLPLEGQGFGNSQNLDQNTEKETEKLMPHLLKNTELKIKVTEIDEKRLLSERLFSIERFAAQSAAGSTITYEGKQTLKKLIDGALDDELLKEFLDRQNIRKALGKEVNLEKFGKEVEEGFPAAEGRQESNPDLPFGRDKKKRPRVKKTTRRRR